MQELKQKSQRDATYGLPLHGLLSLLSYSIQDHLLALSTVRWALSHQTSIKIYHRLAHRTIWWGVAFSQLRFLLLKYSKLCQGDIKLNTTDDLSVYILCPFFFHLENIRYQCILSGRNLKIMWVDS